MPQGLRHRLTTGAFFLCRFKSKKKPGKCDRTAGLD